jgi:hypothetical protein
MRRPSGKRSSTRSTLSAKPPGLSRRPRQGNRLFGDVQGDQRPPALSRAAHLQGDPVDVLVRFSNASGNPGDVRRRPARAEGACRRSRASGRRRDRHRLGGARRFLVRTPEDFLAMTGAGSRPEMDSPTRRSSARSSLSTRRRASRFRRACRSSLPPRASRPRTIAPSMRSAWSTAMAESTGAATNGSRRRNLPPG